MAMGCRCKHKICQRCVQVGDVKRCPTCRKPRRRPVVDRKWLKREWRNAAQNLQPCPGCRKSVAVRYLHKHEQRCVKYRDQFDAQYLEESLLLRRQAATDEATIAVLESRLNAQADTIEEYLSASQEVLQAALARTEAQRARAQLAEQVAQVIRGELN